VGLSWGTCIFVFCVQSSSVLFFYFVFSSSVAGIFAVGCFINNYMLEPIGFGLGRKVSVLGRMWRI
jgi:hypothetical protein